MEKWGLAIPGIEWLEAKKHTGKTHTHIRKNYPVPNVNSAEVEKPRSLCLAE